MPLLSLPNELLRVMINFTPPEAIENLLDTCRHLRMLGAARLARHKELIRRYTKVELSRNAFYHPLLLSLALDEDPWVASYVHEIKYRDEDSIIRTQGMTTQESQVVGWVLRAASRSHQQGIATDPYWSYYHDQLSQGMKSLAFYHLLPRLKNLRGLVVRVTQTFDHLNALRVFRSFSPDVLTRLHRVEVKSDTTLRSIQALVFATLPSVRCLNGVNLYDFPGVVDALEHESFQLEVLQMTGSLESDRIRAMLRKMPSLKILHYTRRNTIPNLIGQGPYVWDVPSVVRELELCLGSTLEVLSLHDSELRFKGLPSFRGLERLRVLKIQIGLLTGAESREDTGSEDTQAARPRHSQMMSRLPDSEDIPRLIDILPPNIDRLIFDSCSNPAALAPALRDFGVLHSELTPRLRTFRHYGAVPFPHDIRTELESVGVTIICTSPCLRSSSERRVNATR